MSFQDIEAGQAHPVRSASSSLPQSREDSDFRNLQHSLSLQVFKMNANVQAILKLVDQLGTPKDSANLRKTLHDLTESTRAMAKRGSEDLKKLSTLQSSLPNQKTALQKTSHDLQMSLVAFQRAQQVSAERQRTVVQGVKLAVEDEYHDNDEPEPSPQEQRQAQIMQSQLSPHELAYQESLIQEREAEIREIETGIHELAEIFQDLDNIELNISSVDVDTGAAAEELTTAAEYQRRAGRRAACLTLILAVVAAIVLLALNAQFFTIIDTSPASELLGNYKVMAMSATLLPAGLPPSYNDDWPQILLEQYQQFLTNCMAFVCMTILVWDHMVTFDDEVQSLSLCFHLFTNLIALARSNTFGTVPMVLVSICKLNSDLADTHSKMFTLFIEVKYLFLLNRYLTPLGFTVNMTAYLLPAFSEPYERPYPKKCQHFIRFEGAMTMIGINVVAIMMFYRVYVLYGKMSQKSGKHVILSLGSFLLGEIILNIYLVTKGVPVAHTRGVVQGCEMVFDSSVQLLEDGLLYYLPILLVNVALSFMIAFAQNGSQNLVAHVCPYFLREIISQYYGLNIMNPDTNQVTMMSRISINLKKNFIQGKQDIDSELASMPSPARFAAEQVASVLNITRSAIQDPREGDIQLDRIRITNTSSGMADSDFSVASSPDHWNKPSAV
ncbi:hypothetical protein NP233_g2421 [Leucocoprinus birnbaumii]|uniref:t-SNARE coiled-coil homology domain-containing protein n=1 Tax=Leucocoprinus birnbaumii TaxID=56174 RepID=A0AAD5YZ29_9AGAR|nr:hypothetical protein NP233_g2421 [Leucocoprinus birnbaumii]